MNGCDIAVAAVVIAVVMWNTRRVFHISIAFCNTSIVILQKKIKNFQKGIDKNTFLCYYIIYDSIIKW